MKLLFKIAVGGIVLLSGAYGAAEERPPILGRNLTRENDPEVRKFLKDEGFYGEPKWNENGSVGITVIFKGKVITYKKLEDIPLEVLRQNTSIKDYTFYVTDTNEQLGAFIAYRLWEKYNTRDAEMQISSLPQIRKLLKSYSYMEAFMEYLRLLEIQQTASALENNILNASRPSMDQENESYKYPPQLARMIRTANVEFIKHLEGRIHESWENILKERDKVLGPRKRED